MKVIEKKYIELQSAVWNSAKQDVIKLPSIEDLKNTDYDWHEETVKFAENSEPSVGRGV